ncbi:MAG: amidohydrolase family protein [Bacteroidota bacterium]
MKTGIVMGILVASGAMISCQRTQTVDLIIKNSRTYTVDSSFSIAESFAVHGDTIVATGTNREIARKYNSGRIIDLAGKPVYPGFYDAHCHFTGYADNMRKADLRGTLSFEEVCRLLVEHQKNFPFGWVLGRGWDQNDWPDKKFPDRKDLDQLFPDKPVYLIRIDGHAAIVNSAALELAGITGSTKVAGGEVIQENGRVTGVLVDNAMDLVSALLPGMSDGEYTKALLKAQENCFAVGLTTVADAGIIYSTVQLIDRLHQNKQLKMRVYAMLAPTRENMDNYVSKGVYKTDHLTIRAVKMYADGALGSRGALMLEPYSDAPGKTGFQVTSTDSLRSICRICYDAGYQVATHSIGDSANRLMLNIYKYFLKTRNDLRWRIEHAQIVHPDDFRLFGEYSIVPSVQTGHATSDMSWATGRVGPERIHSAYAYKQLLEQNGWIPNGSDFPIEQINPLYGFFAGFARMDQAGIPESGWQTENALTREECLKAMTIWAAKSCFEDNEKGSLEPGKKADFVVLEKDIMTADPLRVPKIRVLQTWIGGERVYQRLKNKD